MSAQEIKRNYDTRHCVFAIDSISDVYMLPTAHASGKDDLELSTPCRLGSLATVIDDGSRLVLNGNDEWVEDQSSGGGGGGDDDPDYVDDDEMWVIRGEPDIIVDP